jgi:SAM-dependent methyltransferase
VIIDLGTGDGNFVYRCARRNPGSFYIGIDASAGALRKVSERVHRKRAKGGAPNVLFLHASVEDLPSELDGVADEVHVHFPWGSLLRALAGGEDRVLKNLRRICAPGAWLEIVISLDSRRDRSEITRLGLDPVLAGAMTPSLTAGYRAAGFEIIENGVIAIGLAQNPHDLGGASSKRDRPLASLSCRASCGRKPGTSHTLPDYTGKRQHTVVRLATQTVAANSPTRENGDKKGPRSQGPHPPMCSTIVAHGCETQILEQPQPRSTSTCTTTSTSTLTCT